MTDHIKALDQLAQQDADMLDLFHFDWIDDQGGSGDYGLNVGPAEKTFQTLISTTYMFQPNPAFKLRCRAFQFSNVQFEYLQDHDLDTLAFFEQLGPLPDVVYEIDLSLYKDAQSALEAMQEICS